MKSLLILSLLSAALAADVCAKSVEDAPKIAWGKKASDLELGVRLTGEPRAYKVGENLEMEVHIRNTGKAAVSCLIPQDLSPGSGNVPRVLNEQGEPVRVTSVIYTGLIPVLRHDLPAGKSKLLGRLRILLCEPGKDRPEGAELRLGAPPGKYRMSQYESVRIGLKDSRTEHLESGQVEFRIAPEK